MQSSTPIIRRSSVWPLAISLAATLAIEFSFSSCRYLDVSVHDVPSITLWIHVIVTELFSAGFPHSDICGSSDICSLPQLFAAYHVLLRLLVPRHPPYALSCLIFEVILLLGETFEPSGSLSLPFLKLPEYLYSVSRVCNFRYGKNLLIRCFHSSSFYSRLFLLDI